MRLHALAREALRDRFDALAADARSEVHARAAQWLAANGLMAPAAQHALAAGRRDWAYELAERSLYDSLMSRGRLDDVQDWFRIIPSAESDARPRLLLAAAWSFAIGERHAEAERLVARVLARDDIDDELRCECALIRAGGRGVRRRSRPVRRAARSLGGRSAPEGSLASEDPREPVGLPGAAGRGAGPGAPAPAARAARRCRPGSRVSRPVERWDHRPELPVGRADPAGRAHPAAGAAAGGRRSRPARPVPVHARGAAGGCVAGAGPARATRS